MIYVLIVVTYVNWGANVSMQEFSNVDRCKIAAEHIIKAAKDVVEPMTPTYSTRRIAAICMEK